MIKNERHNDYFLHLLTQGKKAFQEKPESCEFSEPDPYWKKAGKRDLRFSIVFPDEIEGDRGHLQVGASVITYTGLFNTGHPVLNFFAFYWFKTDPEDKYSRDYLYNSALYIYRKPWFGDKCLVPYKRRWYQRLIKGFNDLFAGGSTSPLWQFQDADKMEQEIEQALIDAVFTAIRATKKQKQAKEVLSISVSKRPNQLN